MKSRPKGISHIVVSLPLLLPVMELHIDLSDDKGMKQMRGRSLPVPEIPNSKESLTTERSRQFHSCEQAIKQLEEGISHIKVLEEHLIPLTEYWTELGLILGQISKRLEALRKDPTLKMQFRDLHKKYERVRGDFLNYKLGVR